MLASVIGRLMSSTGLNSCPDRVWVPVHLQTGGHVPGYDHLQHHDGRVQTAPANDRGMAFWISALPLLQIMDVFLCPELRCHLGGWISQSES